MKNKVVIVTGASSGIGRQTALALRDMECIVYDFSRRDIPAENVRHISVDVTNENAVIQAVDAVAKSEGGIDAVINCAGFGVVDAAVEAVGCVVVGYEGYDFEVFEDYREFAYFFRYLATEGHFVFVVRCEYEWFAPSVCEDGAEGVVVGVVVAAFELEGFDVRLCEPYVYARIREGLDCFATDGNCELAVCFVICMCDVHVERCD